MRPRRARYFFAGLTLALAVACTPGDTSIGWADFIRFDGITYLRAGPASAIDDADLGPQFAEVLFNVSQNVTRLPYDSKDGDAAYLDAGTPVYALQGYAPSFRLAARRDGELFLFEAHSNPAATRGGELLDIGGKVEYIGINSEVDGSELAAIDDPQEVAALVEMVLAAPVDQQSREYDDPRYFIAFHLSDGTEVAHSYWLDSGELYFGIMLPPEFRVAVERALPRSE